MFDNVTRCSWQGNTLVECSSTSVTQAYYAKESYSWGTELLVRSEREGTEPYEVRYSLSPNGYPTKFVRFLPESDQVFSSATYEYHDCRLVKRTAARPDGLIVQSANYTYEYDAVGHMTARRDGEGSLTRFDYSCWSR